MQREYSSDFLTFFNSFLLSEFAKFASTHSELFLEKVFLNRRWNPWKIAAEELIFRKTAGLQPATSLKSFKGIFQGIC